MILVQVFTQLSITFFIHLKTSDQQIESSGDPNSPSAQIFPIIKLQCPEDGLSLHMSPEFTQVT